MYFPIGKPHKYISDGKPRLETLYWKPVWETPYWETPDGKPHTRKPHLKNLLLGNPTLENPVWKTYWESPVWLLTEPCEADLVPGPDGLLVSSAERLERVKRGGDAARRVDTVAKQGTLVQSTLLSLVNILRVIETAPKM